MTRTDFPLDRLLSKYGLEHHAALIHEGLEPSVRMNVGTKAARSLRIGTSKFGGPPHLAEGTFWPVRHNADHPLQFLAQIHLADLPDEFREASPLPRDGWLFFWFDILANWRSTHTRLPPPEPLEYPYGLVTRTADDACAVARNAHAGHRANMPLKGTDFCTSFDLPVHDDVVVRATE